MIRAANLSDISRINELGKLISDNFEKVNHLNEFILEPIARLYVYEIDGLIVGFLMAVVLVDTSDIIDIVVDPSYRNKKIATSLIDYFISGLEQHTKIITLEVKTSNQDAIRLYEKFGFEVVKVREKYYLDSDAYLMVRDNRL